MDAWSTEASRAAPWKHLGWSKSWFVDDVVLGAAVYKEEVNETRQTTIPMPEGSYPAVVKMTKATWTRPRSRPVTMERATVEMLVPIPIPGKGENSWDCEDDALYSLTTPADSVNAARLAVMSSAMRDRMRRGGPMRWPTAPETAPEMRLSPAEAK